MSRTPNSVETGSVQRAPAALPFMDQRPRDLRNLPATLVPEQSEQMNGLVSAKTIQAALRSAAPGEVAFKGRVTRWLSATRAFRSIETGLIAIDRVYPRLGLMAACY